MGPNLPQQMAENLFFNAIINDHKLIGDVKAFEGKPLRRMPFDILDQHTAVAAPKSGTAAAES